ncbi:phosphate acyltransferase PlsX [Wohlfahrtiimonas chitiniclastica]|uniref:phosphate acyltransferase PlsX n=1 Tax=Wohlfahrtiimonas chitiniclastica TaxID=400946 RepID=UPI001BCE56BC|nr:phosphate acyltransferase PlsX [Wohlfahrtiimonas chitiniclastica]MBS7822326.1 phosphate acyltransferase PlsX [Wohlfahrtiimonas chitiniclastica]MBS7830388.1 phosphate acyltransferase PlsX [Wohlfahrtiimonas chitiniclastica]MBS7832356.1 phosphate acyltransferase PlsX [Wohlfahrtiimonas chitiniclastica]
MLNQKITIAVDVMSGDKGLAELLPAVISTVKEHDQLTVIAVGQQEQLKAHIGNHPMVTSGRIVIHHASEVVAMDEQPQSALKNKKDSSMRVAINLVKNGQAMACVSAGNTGALMATARFVLKTMPGIDRPAICTVLPSIRSPYKHVHMLDLGANVDEEPKHLQQFAMMGSLIATAVDKNENPKVALLNIGSEAIKGNSLVRETAKLLQNTDVNYIGFVEGDGIFFDDVDVVVCDGFSGNVALKTLEGSCKLVAKYLEASYKQNIFTKMAALISKPVLSSLKSKVDPRNYNGASLLGLRGIVVKSHGNADRISFANAINIAIKLADQDVVGKIEKQFSVEDGITSDSEQVKG